MSSLPITAAMKQPAELSSKLLCNQNSPCSFVDLPQEIQDTILAMHLDCERLEVRGSCTRCLLSDDAEHSCDEHLTARMINELPGLAIERTCRTIYEACRAFRDRWWPRTLIVNDKVSVHAINAQLATENRFSWLQSHIHNILYQEVKSYALKAQAENSWLQLATNFKNTRNFLITRRDRGGRFDWGSDDYEDIAPRWFPDGLHLRNLQPAHLTALAQNLRENFGDNCSVKLESCVWWLLVGSDPAQSYWKTIEYDFGGGEEPRMVSKRFELRKPEDAIKLDPHDRFGSLVPPERKIASSMLTCIRVRKKYGI